MVNISVNDFEDLVAMSKPNDFASWTWYKQPCFDPIIQLQHQCTKLCNRRNIIIFQVVNFDEAAHVTELK